MALKPEYSPSSSHGIALRCDDWNEKNDGSPNISFTWVFAHGVIIAFDNTSIWTSVYDYHCCLCVDSYNAYNNKAWTDFAQSSNFWKMFRNLVLRIIRFHILKIESWSYIWFVNHMKYVNNLYLSLTQLPNIPTHFEVLQTWHNLVRHAVSRSVNISMH